MSTELPRPRLGAEIRVSPSLTRAFLDPDRPAVPDPHAGEYCIVVGYDHPVPSIDRRTGAIGNATWDLKVAFFGGGGSVYDMDEVEVIYDSPWPPTADEVETP